MEWPDNLGNIEFYYEIYCIIFPYIQNTYLIFITDLNHVIKFRL